MLMRGSALALPGDLSQALLGRRFTMQLRAYLEAHLGAMVGRARAGLLVAVILAPPPGLGSNAHAHLAGWAALGAGWPVAIGSRPPRWKI